MINEYEALDYLIEQHTAKAYNYIYMAEDSILRCYNEEFILAELTAAMFEHDLIEALEVVHVNFLTKEKDNDT